jgi:hypothetical protein
MKNSLQEFLAILYPSLDENLASPNSIERLDSISKLLPSASIISDAGFECHFAKKTLNTDILVSFAKPNRHMLINSFDSLSELAKNSCLWERINKLIKKWTSQDSLIYEHVENIWLEFDIDSNNILEPSLFFCPSELIYPGAITNFMKYDWIVKEVLELLVGEQISDMTNQYLSKCFNLLPSKGNIFQVGVMMPRLSESKAIRLCVKNIEISNITKYLHSIGWIDTTNDLDLLLNELSIFTDNIAINVSVENGIHSKIGLECYIDKQPESTSQWQMFFEFMMKKKLCTKEEILGLLKWPGYIEERSFTGIWPSNFTQASAFAYPDFRSAATRAINHIKIVYQPMKPIQAKAYLWFGHRWIKSNGSLQK